MTVHAAQLERFSIDVEFCVRAGFAEVNGTIAPVFIAITSKWEIETFVPIATEFVAELAMKFPDPPNILENVP